MVLVAHNVEHTAQKLAMASQVICKNSVGCNSIYKMEQLFFGSNYLGRSIWALRQWVGKLTPPGPWDSKAAWFHDC